MLTLPIDKAVSEMVLALPVMHPDKPGHILLKPGCVLDDRSIERLKELHVRMVSIKYPPTEFLMRYASPAILAEQSRLAERVGGEIDKMTTSLHAELDFDSYAVGVRSLISRLVDDPTAAVFMQDVIDARQSLSSHSFNVGLLSLMMALKLDGYLVANRPRITPRRATNIENLGLGALLHDIGITRLSRDVISRFEKTQDEDDEAWQKHVLLGFELIKGRLPATASAAILHHHQRLDGSGFPRRVRGFGPPTALRGNEIHIFARIVAVADVFDRFRNPPGKLPSGEPTPQAPTVRALKKTLELVRAGKLDAVVFKSLLTVVPAFAPGSVVTLNTGRQCIVASWDPTLPCSPTVLPLTKDVLSDVKRAGPGVLMNAPGEPIDLVERRDLRITSIDDVDVTNDLFEPNTQGEFDLRLQFPSGLTEGWDGIVEATLAAGGRVG